MKISAGPSMRSFLRRVIGPVSSHEQITAVGADAELAKSLAIQPGYPTLRRVRCTFDSKDQPIEFNINHYHTDRYTLSLDLKARSWEVRGVNFLFEQIIGRR